MTCVATVDLPQPPLWFPMTTTRGPKAPVLPPCCAMTRTPLYPCYEHDLSEKPVNPSGRAGGQALRGHAQTVAGIPSVRTLPQNFVALSVRYDFYMRDGQFQGVQHPE